jgi:signal transduction histidine kinase
MIAMTSAAEPLTAALGPVGAGRARGAVAGVRVVGFGVPALIAIDIVLHLDNGSTDLTSWWLGDVALAMLLAVPGVLVAAKRPDNAIGWLLCVAAFSTALSGAGREYLLYGFLGGTAPGWLWIGWFADSIYMLSMGTLPLTLMLFPDGRPMSRRARWLLGLPIAAIVLGVLASLFYKGGDLEIRGRMLRNPAAGVLPEALPQAVMNASMAIFFASVVAAIGVLVLRYRRSSGDVRLQMKWVVWAGTFGVLELSTEMLPNNPVATITGPVASGLLTVSVGIAILRHRMLDIDLVINRSIVFVALTALVGGGYVALVVAFDTLFNESTHLGPGMIATALVAVAFAPARTRLQRGVDRLMYGERKNPYRVMTQLGRRLESEDGSGELAVVVTTVVQALKLPYAAIFDSAGAPLASTGTAGGVVAEYPLGYQGVPVGHLLVSPPAGSREFGRDEQALLTDLARQVGAAVHAVRLSGALQASRQRLVTAKEEERLRLRRDLHDGLGPKLAALGLKLDAARVMVDTQPVQARELLGAVKGDIRETIEDIRRLVYGLRPPALDELGLAGAIRERVQSFATGTGPELVVTAPERLPALPAAVEVAAYWIANEAITNVVRHASAQRCEVRLELSGGVLLLTVRDDGVGLSEGWRAGVGTSSMAERASELGGELRMLARSDRPGTEVFATIPVLARTPAPEVQR